MFRFTKFSKKQRQVLNWWCDKSPVKDKDGIIADGAIRSGKTVAMSLSFVMWAMSSFNGYNFGMCGKTIGSLRRNVITSLLQMARARGYTITEHRADNMLIIEKGNVKNTFYLFGGKDERSQDLVQGITLAGVLFDEVALMPESFVNQATGRCSVDGSKFWFNCNPDGPYHWFKMNWIDKADDKNMLVLHFTMDDNLSLAEKIKERYRKQYSGVFYRRYILGEWRIAEGTIYDMFEEKRHIKRYEEKDFSNGRYISIDYGTQNATVFLYWRQLKNGTWHCEKEYYYSGRDLEKQKTDEEYVKDLKAFVGDIPVRTVVVDPSAASFIAALRKAGFHITKAENAVLDGIRETASLLNNDKISFDTSCNNIKKEFSSYAWDEKAVLRGEDKPMKTNDHAMDAIRYFVMTVVAKPKARIGNKAALGI